MLTYTRRVRLETSTHMPHILWWQPSGMLFPSQRDRIPRGMDLSVLGNDSRSEILILNFGHVSTLQGLITTLPAEGPMFCFTFSFSWKCRTPPGWCYFCPPLVSICLRRLIRSSVTILDFSALRFGAWDSMTGCLSWHHRPALGIPSHPATALPSPSPLRNKI